MTQKYVEFEPLKPSMKRAPKFRRKLKDYEKPVTISVWKRGEKKDEAANNKRSI